MVCKAEMRAVKPQVNTKMKGLVVMIGQINAIPQLSHAQQGTK
jgi:hypothetical protein